MSKHSLESRLKKLENLAENQSADEVDLSSLCIEEFSALVVASLWDVKGICDDLIDSHGKASPEDVQELRTRLADPDVNEMIVEGWNRYLSERGIEAPVDASNRLVELVRKGE